VARSVTDFIIAGMVDVGMRGRSGRLQQGFTLPELMIVCVVVGVLAVIALPTFMDSVRKSRRAEAITLLNQIAQQQERWRSTNPTYTADLSSAGLNVANPSSGYYTLSASVPALAASAATAYSVTASAAGAQLSDARCTSLTLSMSGGNISYGHTGSATANQCWNR
jgi:type IV pilus assembly protein PilE